MRVAVVSAAILILSNAAFAEELQRFETDTARGLKLHGEFDSKTFRALESAQKPLDLGDIDYDLLAAAVFHETNRRREQHNLPALGHKQQLREAARIQARGMTQEKKISHIHPEEETQMLTDRLHQVGVKGRFSAENVALTSALQYESGKPFYTREKDGKKIFSYEPGGSPIASHSYISFAEKLLDGWMNSPGHRKNILNKESLMLGAESIHSVAPNGMDIFFSAQVFFAPLDLPEDAILIRSPGAP